MTAAQNHRDIPTPANGHDEATGSTSQRQVTQRQVTQQHEARRRWPSRTRVGGLWVAAVVFALVLLLLLIFILENGQRAEVSFFGTHGHLPMGVALLLAAVFGVLLVALPGTARIIQLRLLSRRHADRANKPLTAPIPPPPQGPGQPGGELP